MKIKFISATNDTKNLFENGIPFELPDDQAQMYIDQGIAVLVEDEPKRPTAKLPMSQRLRKEIETDEE